MLVIETVKGNPTILCSNFLVDFRHNNRNKKLQLSIERYLKLLFKYVKIRSNGVFFFLVLTEFTRKKLKLGRSFFLVCYTFSQFFFSYLSYNLCKMCHFLKKRSIIPGYHT